MRLLPLALAVGGMLVPLGVVHASCAAGVTAIVGMQYGKAPAKVAPGDKVAVDGPNTIEDVEIKQSVEERFPIKIPDDEWRRLSTVADVAGYVRGHAAGCD